MLTNADLMMPSKQGLHECTHVLRVKLVSGATENSQFAKCEAKFVRSTDLTQRVMVRGVRLGGSRQKAT